MPECESGLEGICRDRSEELSSLLDKNRGSSYDVLAAFSGGKDSAYLVHYLSAIQGRRILALTWDHGHLRETAWKNINQVLRHAGTVDWECFSHRYDYMTLVRQALLLELKDLCLCAHFVNLRALSASIREGIPFIAFGFSPAQTARRGRFSILPPAHRRAAFQGYVASFRRLLSHCLGQQNPTMAAAVGEYLFGRLEQELGAAPSLPVFLEVSSYISWNVPVIREAVAQLGWSKDPQAGEIHTNCIFEPMRGHIEYCTGKTLLKSELDHAVQTGDLSSEEAALELRTMGYCPDSSVSQAFLDFVRLPRERFYDALSQPVSPRCKRLLTEFIAAAAVARGYLEAKVPT